MENQNLNKDKESGQVDSGLEKLSQHPQADEKEQLVANESPESFATDGPVSNNEGNGSADLNDTDDVDLDDDVDDLYIDVDEDEDEEYIDEDE